MGYYKDLREYVGVLRAQGMVYTIERQINKDTELQPLVRWQFRGLPEKDRKPFLFQNVTRREWEKVQWLRSRRGTCGLPTDLRSRDGVQTGRDHDSLDRSPAQPDKATGGLPGHLPGGSPHGRYPS